MEEIRLLVYPDYLEGCIHPKGGCLGFLPSTVWTSQNTTSANLLLPQALRPIAPAWRPTQNEKLSARSWLESNHILHR